ncbi:phiSA1p31-related protein [Streptomyces sp. NPDC006638]|uniref:phiSA1p31-related protein n=1 Tax=Streptomyces sp. NPDC006638 TaxID=3157183 RepID=UPI0033A6F780
MAFAVDTKIQHSTFGAGTVAFGPFDRHGEASYLIRHENGHHSVSTEDAMSATPKTGLFKVGDKVSSRTRQYTIKGGPFFGPVCEWYAITSSDDVDYQLSANQLTLVEAAPETGYEYKGITYEYGVRYLDRDTDAWTFQRPSDGGEPVSDDSSCINGWPLSHAVESYGPLRKF